MSRIAQVTVRTFQSKIDNHNIHVRTKPTLWLNTESPVIVPLSIISKFNEGHEGRLKLTGLLQTVKANVKGKMTVLICEGAHWHTSLLEHCNDPTLTSRDIEHQANLFIENFENELSLYEMTYWKNFVTSNGEYDTIKKKLDSILKTNTVLNAKLLLDAEKTYNETRAHKY